MKIRLTHPLLALALILTAVGVMAKDNKKEPDNRPKLAVVVVDNLDHHGSAITAFDRLDIAFQEVADTRKWPVAIAAERFAANTPSHETELRIVTQPLRRDTPPELTFRAWMTLTIQGEKHDLGIVSFRYLARPGENSEDVLDKIYLGAANAGADKIEPFLFPREPAAPKS